MYRKSEMTPALLKMLEQEINFLKTLDHPNIIKCTDVIEDTNKIYVVCDSVRGKSLYMHVMEHGELNESECAIISAQIVSILRYLQQKEHHLRT